MQFKQLLYKLKSKILTWFGNIKVFKYPFWMIYDPSTHEVTGNKILNLMEVVKPGDILLRGFSGYLDGYFITSSRGYSHAGIYVGNNEVIHSVAPEVEKLNILDFCECDRIAIVRPIKYSKGAVKKANKFLTDKTPYDFNYTKGRESVYCFELAAECYPKLKLEKMQASIFWGLINKKEKIYLSDSFFSSEDFELIFEYNPKYNIDFQK